MADSTFERFIDFPPLHGTFDGFQLLSVDIQIAPRGTRRPDGMHSKIAHTPMGGRRYARHSVEEECRALCGRAEGKESVQRIHRDGRGEAEVLRLMDGGPRSLLSGAHEARASDRVPRGWSEGEGRELLDIHLDDGQELSTLVRPSARSEVSLFPDWAGPSGRVDDARADGLLVESTADAEGRSDRLRRPVRWIAPVRGDEADHRRPVDCLDPRAAVRPREGRQGQARACPPGLPGGDRRLLGERGPRTRREGVAVHGGPLLCDTSEAPRTDGNPMRLSRTEAVVPSFPEQERGPNSDDLCHCGAFEHRDDIAVHRGTDGRHAGGDRGDSEPLCTENRTFVDIARQVRPQWINIALDAHWLTLPTYEFPLDRYDWYLDLSVSLLDDFSGVLDED